MTNLSVIFFTSRAILAHSDDGFHASRWRTDGLVGQVFVLVKCGSINFHRYIKLKRKNYVKPLKRPENDKRKPQNGLYAVHGLHLFDDLCSVCRKK